MIAWWILLVSLIIAIPISIFIGYWITRKMVQNELRKNPPISEKQIRAMLLSMGQKPSEAKIRQIMHNMKNAK